jgi:hypothetical protein
MLVFWIVTPRRVDLYVDNNVSEKHNVSIFRAEVSILRAEDGDSMFLRNVSIYLQVHTTRKINIDWRHFPRLPTTILNVFFPRVLHMLKLMPPFLTK